MKTTQQEIRVWPGIFAAVFGLLLGVALLKFGNPVIMEKYVDWPLSPVEWFFFPWPVALAHFWLGVTVAVGLPLALIGRNFKLSLTLQTLPVVLPLTWLAWELIAGTQTTTPQLSHPTLIHFAACVACFYLGYFSLGRVAKLWPFWLGVFIPYGMVLVSGFEQHFGGLEASQHYWMESVYPTLKEIPPGLMKKMTSTRIFATLFYPNTLAQIILLTLPVLLGWLWSLRARFTAGARGLLLAIAAAPSLACLFWSGSKGGWLIMLAVGLVFVLGLRFERRYKNILVTAMLLLGLAGFFLKYAGFFQRGATSVVARGDYWRAALQTVKQKPLFGIGPGAFGVAYQKLKKPDSEMALLTHNDYLEQASDSGILGFFTFTAMIAITLVYTFRQSLKHDEPEPPREHKKSKNSQAPPATSAENSCADYWIRLGAWLGLLGWAAQSFLEFGLYIPAVAWLAFALMGWLLSQKRT